MEDEIVIMDKIKCGTDTPDTAFFGVFDGNGGGEASEYASRKMATVLSKSRQYSVRLDSALRNAFMRVDRSFLKRSKQRRWESGTTAVVAALRGNRLYVGHTGDSRALLCRR